MAQTDQFSTMLLALQGETILVQPRVSRETIISVLKEHTELLRDMKMDVSKVMAMTEDLTRTNQENAHAIHKLQKGFETNKENIEKIEQRTTDIRASIDVIQKKILEINDLRDQLKDTKATLYELKDNYDNFKTEMVDFLAQTKSSIEFMEKQNNDTYAETKEIRRVVDNFADNIVISSTQVTVESSAGFAKRPMPLLDILKDTSAKINAIDNLLLEHGHQLIDSFNSLNTKADASLAISVQSLDRDIASIKAYLKKEEDTGIHAIRRTCEQLTVQVEMLQVNLTEKIDRNTTEVIVQRKYEDIVQYLQDALQGSADDEDNFKNIVNDLEQKIKILTSSKCDRKEIQPLQESLVKAEATVAKLMKQINSQTHADHYTKVEVLSLLDQKVDKESAETLINDVLKGKRKKLASMVNEAITNQEPSRRPQTTSSAAMDITTVGSKAQLIRKESTRNMMMSRSVENLNDDSHSNVQGTNNLYQVTGSAGTGTGQGLTQDQGLAQIQDDDGNIGNSSPTTQSQKHRLGATGTNSHYSSESRGGNLPESRGGHGHLPNVHGKGGPSASSFHDQQRNRRDQTSSAPYGNNGFPTNAPGQFRQPSEKGKAGGIPPGGFPPSNAPISKNRSSPTHDVGGSLFSPDTNEVNVGNFGDLYFQSNYAVADSLTQMMSSNTEAATTPKPRDMSHVNSNTMGGGFNLRSKSPPTINPISTGIRNQDREGDGSMTVGNDGHYYYVASGSDKNKSSSSKSNLIVKPS